MLAVALDDPSSRIVAYLYLVLVPLTVPITVVALNRKRKKRKSHSLKKGKFASARLGRVDVAPSAYPSIFRSGEDKAFAAPDRRGDAGASLFDDVSDVNTLALRHQRKVAAANES